MGCGGSRADAIEPRYYESWTRETESTWLTNTDSESPPEPGGAEPGSREPGAGRADFPRLEKYVAINAFVFSLYTKALPKRYHFLFHNVVKIQSIIPVPGILEDGKSTQTGGTTTPGTTGILSTEKRTISGTQCVNATGAGPPRQSSFRAAEEIRAWFSAPSSEQNQPSWDSVIPYCKDDLEVKDSADESSLSNSEGPSTSKTEVESRINGTHRKCQRKKSPLMSQKPSDPVTEG